MRFFADCDPLTAARRVGAPALVLQGETDQQVPPAQATALAAAMRAGGSGAVVVRLFSATNHLFPADPAGDPTGDAALPSKRVRPAVLGVLADWLAARLGAVRDATPVHEGACEAPRRRRTTGSHGAHTGRTRGAHGAHRGRASLCVTCCTAIASQGGALRFGARPPISSEKR